MANKYLLTYLGGLGSLSGSGMLGPSLGKQQVLVSCDNQAAVGTINKGSTGSPSVMQALHRLFWLSAIYKFGLIMQYILGSLNIMADAVSRLHFAAGFLLGVCGLSANQLWLDGLGGHMPYASSLFLSTRYRSCAVTTQSKQ